MFLHCCTLKANCCLYQGFRQNTEGNGSILCIKCAFFCIFLDFKKEEKRCLCALSLLFCPYFKSVYTGSLFLEMRRTSTTVKTVSWDTFFFGRQIPAQKKSFFFFKKINPTKKIIILSTCALTSGFKN